MFTSMGINHYILATVSQTLYNQKWVDSKEVFWFKKYRLAQGVKKSGNEKYIFNERVKVDVNIRWNGYYKFR